MKKTTKKTMAQQNIDYLFSKQTIKHSAKGTNNCKG